MKNRLLFAFGLSIILFASFSTNSDAFRRPDKEFKIFQFPADKIPVIDGKASDWSIVPDSYAIGMDELEDDVYHSKIDKKDKDVKVKVAGSKE